MWMLHTVRKAHGHWNDTRSSIQGVTGSTSPSQVMPVTFSTFGRPAFPWQATFTTKCNHLPWVFSLEGTLDGSWVWLELKIQASTSQISRAYLVDTVVCFQIIINIQFYISESISEHNRKWSSKPKTFMLLGFLWSFHFLTCQIKAPQDVLESVESSRQDLFLIVFISLPEAHQRAMVWQHNWS